jgi:hypothetical protein
MANVAPRVRRPGLPGTVQAQTERSFATDVSRSPPCPALQWFPVIAIAALSLYTALLLWLIRAGRREEGSRPSLDNASISAHHLAPAATDRRAALPQRPTKIDRKLSAPDLDRPLTITPTTQRAISRDVEKV